jgi:PAS domain S-box-containing protein
VAAEEQTPFVAATETELLHRLVEFNPGYLWATDRELRYTALFGRRLHDQGWMPAEMYGVKVTEFAGGVPPGVVEAHERALAGETVSYEFELNERCWRARVQPLVDAEGAIIGVAGASLDTTELVRAAHELDESRAKLDLALGQLPAILWATDEKLRLTSAAGRPIGGRDVASWIGQPLGRLFGDDAHPAVAAHEAALAGGSGAYELVLDGRDYEIRVEPLRAQDGRIVGAVGLAIDVTDRADSRHMVERLASIVLHSTDAIAGVDRAGRIFCWNPAAEQLFGWTEEEMLGQTSDRLIPPEERPEWEALRGRVLEGEMTEQLAATRIRKDGTPVRIWVVRTPIRTASGEVAGFSVISRDTAHLEEAAERRQTSERLEALARLAGGIAQDFNNLMTAVAGYAELARREAATDPAREALDAILAATDRATTLTDGLLAFSRRRLLQPQPVDLNALVEETQPLLTRFVGAPFEVRAELGADAGSVLVDPSALRQILFDLALNAKEAMPGGGTVVVETAGTPVHGIVRIRDTGIGMDATTRARAFDPFYSTKAPVTGSGLGLAAVHGTVLQSGGELRLDSTPGGGTSVEILLPRADAATASASAGGTTGAHVLLVEDEELVRRLVVQTLTTAGYAVTAPDSPGEALALVSGGERFDVLLTDLVMPELYGDELVAQARLHQPDLAAIVMSGYVSDPDSFPESVEFLPKPFRTGELVATLARVLAGRPAQP